MGTIKRFYINGAGQKDLIAIICYLHTDKKKECVTQIMGTETIRKDGGRVLLINENGTRRPMKNKVFLRFLAKKQNEALFCYPQ